jgi:NAD(P)-dependent dehydrogenase (short-subunit alcohol dehydrogenase family)
VDALLEGRSALVTGASRGIGLAIARRLADAGANVVITSRDPAHLEAAVSTFSDPSRVEGVVAHAGRSPEISSAVERTLERFGSLEVLVNNAATNPYFGPLVEIDEGRLAKTVEVNQVGVLLHVAAAWRHWMRDHGGVVLNVASIGGLQPEAGIGWYNVTKAAVIALTRQLAIELAPRVRVNAIAPGLVRTEFARGLWEGREEQLRATIPLGRIGEPEDVASMALALVSDLSAWVTGQTIVVDGGTTTRPTGGVVTE